MAPILPYFASRRRLEQTGELLDLLSRRNPAAGMDDFQAKLFQYLLKITRANGLLFLIRPEGEPPHTERLYFSRENELQRLEPLPIQPERFQQAFSAAAGTLHDLRSDPFQTLMKDLAPQYPAKKVWCQPVQVHQQTLGVLLIRDPRLPENLHLPRLIGMAAAGLAQALSQHRQTQNAQITIADLEASRWELLNSRNTLRTLFDNIPISIYIVNQDYTIAAINQRRASQSNLPIPRIVGRKCYKVLFNRDGICPGCQINQSLLEGKDSLRLHQIWEKEEDRPLELEIASYPVLNADKNVVQAIMVENDITEKRRLEESLIQNEKLAAVGQLAAGMAHEINNPLTAIIANAQLIMRDTAKNTDIYESADLIEQAGLRASQTIQELLRFSRQDSYTFTKTDLNLSIEKVIALLHHELVKKNVQVSQDLQPNIPLINASEDHLQSVWINLIMNALDAAAQQALEIKITTRYADGEFLILVADNGQGIPQDRLSRIFTPFFTTKAPGQGTGLGLSICHRIVKNHGGEIRVESRPQHGTRFVIILPETYP